MEVIPSVNHIVHCRRRIKWTPRNPATSGDFGNMISYMKLPLCLGKKNKIRLSRAHCPVLLVIPKGWFPVTCPKEWLHGIDIMLWYVDHHGPCSSRDVGGVTLRWIFFPVLFLPLSSILFFSPSVLLLPTWLRTSFPFAFFIPTNVVKTLSRRNVVIQFACFFFADKLSVVLRWMNAFVAPIRISSLQTWLYCLIVKFIPRLLLV